MIRIFEMGKIRDEEIFARFEPTSSVEDIVKDIIARVRAEGDAALRAYSAEFDHVDLQDFLVSEAEMQAALEKVEPEFIAVLEEAAANIRAFHSKQVRNSFIMADKPGVILGQRVIPLEKVGLYVPGGTAAYPSTVLMDSIPAKIAGVEEIVMVTPPNKEGSVNP
ncbi:MAG TPA: histidinol dehydrogenase, partial [Oribacterium sp.]|nr:histidinol dehydrogenase [Oribacterium sp.]